MASRSPLRYSDLVVNRSVFICSSVTRSNFDDDTGVLHGDARAETGWVPVLDRQVFRSVGAHRRFPCSEARLERNEAGVSGIGHGAHVLKHPCPLFGDRGGLIDVVNQLGVRVRNLAPPSSV